MEIFNESMERQCPECMEDVDICTNCSELIHYDDPKVISGRGIYCHWCYKKIFREQCTNRRSDTQNIEGYPV